MLDNRWFQFLILSSIFFAVEYFWPLEKRKTIREGLFQDIFCWVILMDFYLYPLVESYFDERLYRGFRDLFFAGSTDTALSVQSLHPIWQFVIVFLVMELINYLVHRYVNHSFIFWDFHKTHHSSLTLDQFSDARHHPASILFETLVLAIPVLMILNPSLPVTGVFGVFSLVWGPLIHMNVKLKWPFPLSHILSSPHTHRWHHAKEKGIYCNYAGIFIFYDVLFRTYYSPEHDCQEVGFENDEDYIRTPQGMLLYPFKQSYNKLKRNIK